MITAYIDGGARGNPGPAGIAESYIITAVPLQTDPACPQLTLNQLGVFLPAGC